MLFRDWHGAAARACATVFLSLLAIVLVAFPGDAADRSGPLSGVRRWGYQLQNPKVERLAASPHDLLVIDFSADGSGEAVFSKADVDRIRQRPNGGKRIVLAYLSIGEAETYRDYWRWWWGDKWYTNWMRYVFGPSWLGPENASWGGNFAVRFWDPGWQRLILGPGGYLERILAAGFDGVYLDKIDSSIEAIARNRPTAQDDMRAFVRKIAEAGRAGNPRFAVVPQNGEELLVDDAYVDLIDGLGKEDLLYGEYKEKEANPEKVVGRRIELLKRATAKGKTVLAVEYLDDAQRIAGARRRLEELGFVVYFGDRELKTLRYGDLPESAR
ncbi:MAG: endo alpha-1,4 polygalactosaminidase [Proteobacteria bacterium]|nr:endo alpha-1,4 polygalactosaminidase [Pseudomonadota bacterium]